MEESPRICLFLKNNGDLATLGPPLHYFPGMDMYRYSDFLLYKKNTYMYLRV